LKIVSLEDFYRRKFNWLPENFRKEVGHFNIFRLEPYVEGKPTKIPYRRRDFYKIMLVRGNSKIVNVWLDDYWDSNPHNFCPHGTQVSGMVTSQPDNLYRFATM